MPSHCLSGLVLLNHEKSSKQKKKECLTALAA